MEPWSRIRPLLVVFIVILCCSLVAVYIWRRFGSRDESMRRRPSNAEFTGALPESEYQGYEATGSGVIRGRAFLRVKGGIMVLDGGAIYVNPKTSLSAEWYDSVIKLNGNYRRKADLAESYRSPTVESDKYTRVVAADSKGNFVVSGLPPGVYYLTRGVVWHTETHWYDLDPLSEGYRFAIASAEVKVEMGSQLEVDVTRDEEFDPPIGE